MTRTLLALALAASPAVANPAVAGSPPLGLPLACTLGESCFIQQYPDADPGPGASDFSCGPLSYDGHDGTDFALPSLAAMQAGVAVLAAAPGVVRALRDGMPDLGRDGTPSEQLAGQECGNGVVLDHGDGWVSQYCHLKQGSIAVAQGDRVTMGAALGQVGYSGNTQFPHVELILRHDGATVDPFNSDGIATCPGGDGPDDDLWLTPLAYAPGGVIAVGLATGLPDYAAVKSGAAVHVVLPAKAPALVGWAYLFGGRAGDRVEIDLIRPDGTLFFRHAVTLDKTQAQLFRAGGKKTPPEGWAQGDWQVTARLIRDGAPVNDMTATVRLEN